MMKKLRTAVIGVGNMGKNHVRILSQSSHLIGVADTNKQIGKQIARKYNTTYYSDYKELISVEKLEAVSIAVPTKTHYQIALHCLKMGLPTLVEKPIASTLEEAKSLLHIAKKNKSLLMVGHVERFNPAVVMLKKMISKGMFGDLITLLAIRVGITIPRDKGADVSLDLAIHDIDIFNYLLDDFPQSVTIRKQKIYKKNKADCASILLSYKKTTCVIQTNWITPIKIRKLYVTGINSFAEVDYIYQKIVTYNKILPSKKNGSFQDVLAYSKSEKHKVLITKKEPLREELLFFLQKVKNKEIDNESAYYGYKSLEVLLKPQMEISNYE